MAKTAIISVDGHVKASRAGYREYISTRHLPAYDEWVSAAEEAGLPDSGNLNPEYGMDAQWDSTARWNALETQGVVAEVLFPNGQPFQVNRFDDLARAADPELEAEGRTPTTGGWRTSPRRPRVGERGKRWSPSRMSSRPSPPSTGPRNTASVGS